MSTTMKKTLLVALIILVTILGAVGVIYLIRKPASISSLPTPTPTPTKTLIPEESPIVAEVFAVGQNSCSTSFVVACGESPSPSPSPSESPSPSPSPSASPSTPPSAALKCVTKKMYEDDSRNRAGFYYMEKEILDTNTLQNGQTIVYNVVTKNAGGNSVPDTTITDVLASSLTYIDGDSGCLYDATTRTVTCTIGTLSANSEAQRSFRVRVAVAETVSVTNTAEVTSTNGQRDSCSVRIDATGKVVVAESSVPTALPVAGVFEVTVGTVGVGLLLLILGGLGLLLI